MKSIFIVYNQVLAEGLIELLDDLEIRGFTRWSEVEGRGSHSGDPHLGTHIWPGLNGALICIVEEEHVEPTLAALRKLDPKKRGLRAFVWNVEEAI